MNELKEKKVERRSYIYAIIAAIIVMVTNTAFTFNLFEGYINVYFTIVVAVNIIILAILANATYYTTRIKIDAKYVSISFFLFILITDYVVTLIILLTEPKEALELISLFLGLGKITFVSGVVTMKWQKTFSKLYERVRNMIVISLIILFVQFAFVYSLYRISVNIDTVIFMINGLTVMLLVILNYDLVLEENTKNSYAFLFAFSTMLISQLLLTLANNTFTIQIQSNILMGIGFIFFFYHVNRNNFVIPEKVQESLQRQFNLYSMNLKKIIDKKTFQVREANQKFIDEVDYAKNIQQSLLPNANMTYRDVKFVSEYFPCERLSGDFFDHYRLDDDNIALYLLDVSGHGISAALLTMFSTNYLKSNDKNQQLFRGLKPDRTLNYFYEQFNKINFPDEMHMVIFYATLNLNTKILTYCSAGLNCSPIRFRKNGKIEFLDKSEGFPICKLMDLYMPEYRSERVKLEKGDRLLFYTDGLIDDEKNNAFDLDTLIRFVASNRHLAIEELNQRIANVIRPVKESLNDDITYILMEI